MHPRLPLLPCAVLSTRPSARMARSWARNDEARASVEEVNHMKHKIQDLSTLKTALKVEMEDRFPDRAPTFVAMYERRIIASYKCDTVFVLATERPIPHCFRP